jgi:orotate phosphoribosyltransferase
MINYRSIKDLNATIKRSLYILPKDVGLIVGIPRSGLLAANLIALHLNLPFTDLAGLFEKRIFETGERKLRNENYHREELSETKILVVDDSLLSGSSMRIIKKRTKKARLNNEILFGAIFVSPETRSEVDFYFEEICGPRIFEWNLMHSTVITHSCVDIDGVLCEDPTKEQNDDGKRYEKFLINAKPLHLPSRRIGHLVSCRLEKYRGLTEEWLKRHQIKYGTLHLMDLPNKKARLESNSHGSFKAKIYKSTGAMMFIESSLRQAIEICRIANSAVLCTETNEMLYPSLIKYSIKKIPRVPDKLSSHVGKLLNFAARKVFDIDPPKETIK